jgi:hypothetical protein
MKDPEAKSISRLFSILRGTFYGVFRAFLALQALPFPASFP